MLGSVGAGAKLKGAAIGAYLGPAQGAARGWHGLLRKVRGGAHRVRFHHQLDDPWSHLLALALPRLLEAAPGVDLRMVLVPPPAADADPEPHKRAVHAMRDAGWLARRHGLPFPDPAPYPDGKLPADRVRRANAVLLVERPIAAQLAIAGALGHALYADDGDALAALVKEHGTVPGQQVMPALERHYRALRKAGHYQGGMLQYGPEWFWGIDRLELLRARVAPDAPDVLPGRRVFAPTEAPLELFVSFRSPYSYLGAARMQELLSSRPDVPFTLRPVLPMVSRGLSVPRIKRLYIAKDAKREADRQGRPFGKICDPLGEGVERCLALTHALRLRDGDRAALAFVVAAGEAIWARAVDLTEDAGLRAVAAQVGAEDLVTDAVFADSGWRDEAERNREAMSDEHLWGVPCFRHGELVAWGQDRLWMLEERLG